jgi:nucleoside-diphosphate-sugar epimerase
MFSMVESDARAVVRSFKGIARRAIVISSQDVYRAYGVLHGIEPGPPEPVPLAEDAPLRQRLYPNRREAAGASDDPLRWDDDYDKILVERVFLGEPELPGTILRLPAVYGPNDGHRVFEYLKRMDDRRPAILLADGVARWRWTWGFVENVALAVALAVVDEQASGRIYNVAEPDSLPQAEWVRAIGRVAGWKGEVVVVPDDRLPAHLRSSIDTSQDVVADTTRIRRELGFVEVIPRDEALRRTIAWERATPPAEIDPAKFDYTTEDTALAG